MGARKFSEIRRPVTPERRARIDDIKAAMVAAEGLAEIRQGQGVTQVAIAAKLGIKQGSVSELERRSDVYLSTLRAYVEALGGHLDIQAVFPEQRIPIALAGPKVPEIQWLPAGEVVLDRVQAKVLDSVVRMKRPDGRPEKAARRRG